MLAEHDRNVSYLLLLEDCGTRRLLLEARGTRRIAPVHAYTSHNWSRDKFMGTKLSTHNRLIEYTAV
jgi:hypothetical protein